MKTITKTGLAVCITLSATAVGQSNVDPIHRFAWTENAGWLNWQHDAPSVGDGVSVSAPFLAGFVWAENVGWLNLGNGDGPYPNDPSDASTFGVNIDTATGDMFGLAWGENIGWVNFDTRATQGPTEQQARFDICKNRFRGYAWSENVGWINLNDAEHFAALGPDCPLGDVACDGVISLLDFSSFHVATTGPATNGDICELFDFDGDQDVDLADFGMLQATFTGQ